MQPARLAIFFDMGIRKQIIRRFLSPAVSTLLLTVCFVCACSSTPAGGQSAQKDCISEMTHRIREAPEKKYLHTLDGQTVRLQDFFNQCQDNAPDCILFVKFYHWDNKVVQVVSRTDSRPVEHQVRAYYNPLSICQPQMIQPGRTHGDVAEFYDARGQFMGLAVYMGQGQYFLLHYSGYQNSKQSPE